MSDIPGPSPVEGTSGSESTWDLAVAFLRLPLSKRCKVIEDLLGPQQWSDVNTIDEWAQRLAQIRERGLIGQFSEEGRRG